MRSLKILPIGIGEMLLNGEFAVPPYQRSYAWTDTNVSDLLTDLSAAMQRHRDGKADTYFLGSIVIVGRGGDSPLEVVDGQQRLATVSVLLAAIRDYHFGINKEKAAAAYDGYLRWFHVPSGRHLPRLQLNDVDNHCYASTILEPPANRKPGTWPSPSHKRLLAAYDRARQYIENIRGINSAKATIDSLFAIAKFLEKNVLVTRVTVDDDADAFTIFETLNDRQLALSVSDLLKNFIFKMTDKTLDESKLNWRQMTSVLQTIRGKKDRTVDFVRQLWGSMHGLVREKELFRDIKNKITDFTEAREFSHALATQAQDYAAVLDVNNPRWNRYGNTARHALKTFQVLRVERIRSLLLAILSRFDDKETGKALEFLRCAAVRIVVAGGFNGTIEQQVFEIAVKVHQRAIKGCSRLVREMTFVPNDAIFQAHFATMNVSKAPLARFYLQELEDANKDDTSIITNTNEQKVDLEHIIPKAETERKTHWTNLSAEDGQRLSTRLGNLALLPKSMNSRLNGKPFSEKVKVYAECHSLYLTRMIADRYSTWGVEQVEDRQRVLADLALSAWAIRSSTTQGGKRGNRTRPA